MEMFVGYRLVNTYKFTTILASNSRQTSSDQFKYLKFGGYPTLGHCGLSVPEDLEDCVEFRNSESLCNFDRV